MQSFQLAILQKNLYLEEYVRKVARHIFFTETLSPTLLYYLFVFVAFFLSLLLLCLPQLSSVKHKQNMLRTKPRAFVYVKFELQ